MARPRKRPLIINPQTGAELSDAQLLRDAAQSAARWQQRLAAGKTRADRARPAWTRRPVPFWDLPDRED